MRILNYGSINIDHVYRVGHLVRPGETLPASAYRTFAGGKGLNQSVALARAGARVSHAGKVGPGSEWVLDHMQAAGVDTSRVVTGAAPTGHAIIQVDASGQNSILLYGGANRAVQEADIRAAVDSFSEGDFLLLQNEINHIPLLIETAKARGMRVVFNPAPMDAEVRTYPLEQVDYLILNEVEGADLSGHEDTEAMAGSLCERLPSTAVVLTLGQKGSLFACGNERLEVPARRVVAIDTTAAGDTFTGYFLASLARGSGVERALDTATKAAAICVTREGAACSIPTREQVDGMA